MALITPEGNRFKLNQALADFLGYTVDELTNTTMSSTNADKAKLDESMRLRQKVLDGEITTYRNERTYRHKEGHIVWGEVSGSLFRSESGDPEYFIAHTVDITELKYREEALQESESKLREILEKSPMGVSVSTYAADDTQITGNRLFVNEALVNMFGYASAEDMLAADVSKSWVDLRRLRTAQEIMNRKEGLVDFEALRRRVDGGEWWVSLHSRPILFNGVACIMIWHVDLTERRRTEEQLRQSQKMEAVGQLTGGVAHDFNNLLGVVIGNLDFLSDELQDNADLLALAKTATEAAISGATLNRQLLAFSRQQPLSPKAIDLNENVSAMLEMLRRTLGETIEIKAKQGEGLWAADVDPAQVESALLNLAVNARDAMPAGGKLTIETANIKLDDGYAASQLDVMPGEYVMLALTDSGTGMTPETLTRAFEPFFTTKDVGEGSGLGLSMVFGFAKQSGGHVTLHSEAGQGTTVRLYLPRARRAVAAMNYGVRDTPKAEGETVLVVEDDRDLSVRPGTL